VHLAAGSEVDFDRIGPRARVLIGAATGQLTELIVTFVSDDRHDAARETAG